MDKKGSQQTSVTKGCKCVKSACRKSYCVCFKEGVSCKAVCQCVGCENLNTERAYVVNPSIVDINKPAEPPQDPLEKTKKKGKFFLEQIKEEPQHDYVSDRGFDESFISNEDIKNVSRCLFAVLDQAIDANLSEVLLDEILYREAVNCVKGLIDKIKIQSEGLSTTVSQPHRFIYESVITRFLAYKILHDSDQLSNLSSATLSASPSRNENLSQSPKLLNSFHNPIYHNGLPHPMLNDKDYIKYFMIKNQSLIYQELSAMCSDMSSLSLKAKVEDTYIPFNIDASQHVAKPEYDETMGAVGGVADIENILHIEDFSSTRGAIEVLNNDDEAEEDVNLIIEAPDHNRVSDSAESFDQINESLRNLFDLKDF